jgi:hypothetical protein
MTFRIKSGMTFRIKSGMTFRIGCWMPLSNPPQRSARLASMPASAVS